jgi:hypothetical protein
VDKYTDKTQIAQSVTRLRPMPPRKRGSIPINEETLYLPRSTQIKSGALASAGSDVDPATQFITEVKDSGVFVSYFL